MKVRFLSLLLLLLMASLPLAAQDTPVCEDGFRLFDHEYLGGEPVCIPENPQRVAVLDLSPLEVVLINDIAPVAMFQYGRDLIARSNPYINVDVAGLTAETLDVGNSGTVNMEVLLNAAPDLIIASQHAVNTGGVENFEAIAPTVAFSYGFDVSEYRASVEFVSAVLNTPEAGDEILGALDSRLADFKALLGDNVGETEISLVRQRDALVLFVSGSFGDHLIHEAGLVRPEPQLEYDLDFVENTNNGWVGIEVSKENLKLLDGEYVFIWTASPSAEVEAEAQGILSTLLADPLWNTLESAKNEHLFIVGSHWQGFGILEAHAALDDLFRYVLGVDPQEVSPNPFLVSEEAASAEAVYPLTVTHNLGTIEIPAQPERIVALGIGDIATVYGLGLTPVAISANPFAADKLWPWLDGIFDPAQTEIVAYNEPSFEQIIGLDPDIILANNLFTIANIYDSLAEIAPTTAPAAANAIGDTWQQLTLSIGHVLGLDAEAQAAIDETEARIAAVVANYPNLAGKTFSLSYLHAPGALNSINAPSDYAVQFFQSLGFVVTPALAELVASQSGVQAALSLETLNLIEADLVVLAFGSPDVQAEYEANPIYQNLPAVKEGRVVVVDLNVVTQLRGPNVMGIRWVLDRLEPAFAALN